MHEASGTAPPEVRRIEAGKHGAPLEAEAAAIEAEMGHLLDLLGTAPSPGPVKAKIIERSTRLKAKQDELAALAETSGPVRLLPRMTGDDLRARLDDLWREISDPEIDSDQVRLGLEQLFDEIVVTPLDGSWSKGWLLNRKTRPWALVLPKGGGDVVSTFGCGGRI